MGSEGRRNKGLFVDFYFDAIYRSREDGEEQNTGELANEPRASKILFLYMFKTDLISIAH